MIRFKKVRYRNFLSTGNYFTELLLDRSSNTLIVGTNGSGKSTMLDALTFSLFGKPFRDINKPQLLNSINQKDCLVEVEFTIGKTEYKISRGIKPNIFEIYVDGVLLNQDAATRDYQEYLEKFILKLNYKSFTQIVVLGSASFVPFMQLSSADRRSIIEDLLDIQIFSTMNSVLKDSVSINKNSLLDNKHEIDKKTQNFTLQKEHIEKNSQDNEKHISKITLDVAKSLAQIKNIEADNARILDEIKKLEEKIEDKQSLETKLKKLNQLEGQIENNISSSKKTLTFFKNSDDCPTCKQHIEETFKNEQITTLQTKIEESEIGLKQMEEKALEIQGKLNSIYELNKQIAQKNSMIGANNSSISAINDYVKKLNAQVADFNSVKQDLIEEKNKLKKLKEELEKLEENKKKLLEEKQYYEVASNLLKDTGIKTRIIKQYLPIINKMVNKYLSSLDFFINFSFDESFKETIKSRHRDVFTYASFSEGEKQRIDMALMLTWRAIAKMKNSTNTNLLILDEVFDSSLDNNGTEYLMSILHSLENCNLFVISHKGDILQDKFRSVIKFDKVNNFSRIVK